MQVRCRSDCTTAALPGGLSADATINAIPPSPELMFPFPRWSWAPAPTSLSSSEGEMVKSLPCKAFSWMDILALYLNFDACRWYCSHNCCHEDTNLAWMQENLVVDSCRSGGPVLCVNVPYMVSVQSLTLQELPQDSRTSRTQSCDGSCGQCCLLNVVLISRQIAFNWLTNKLDLALQMRNGIWTFHRLQGSRNSM